MENSKKIENLSFEEAMQQLDKIVHSLETGNVELAESIKIYEMGELLKKHCSNLLKNAELKIEKIKVNNSGEYESTTPLEENKNNYIKDNDVPF